MTRRCVHPEPGELIAKRCSKCSLLKTASEFYKDLASRDGFSSQCRQCHGIYTAERRKRPGVREAHRESARWHHKKKAYGITREDYQRIYESQDGKCASCRIDYPAAIRSGLHVDHCHTTGRTRGLLCNSCNAALGHLKESPELAQKLIAYMEAQCR